MEAVNQSHLNLLTQLALVIVLAIAGLLFWQGIHGPFLVDDFVNIPNSYVKNWTLSEIYAATMANESGVLKRPVAAFSFVVTQFFYGEGPTGYKIHNIVIHLACGLMIFLFSLRLLKLLNFNRTTSQWAAVISTAIWLLHPLQVSTVLYAVQRMSQLSALFTLVCLWSYLKARDRSDNKNSDPFYWLFQVAPASAALAIFSKESAALIPLYILLIEALLFGFKPDPAPKTHNMFKIFWGLAGSASVILAIGAIYMATNVSIYDFVAQMFSLKQRILTQSVIVMDYWRFIVTPDIHEMGLFHDDFTVYNSFQLPVIIATCGHLTLTLGAILVRKRWPLLSLCILWFYVSHLLESTILPIPLMFEYRNYLALLGPSLLLGGIIAHYANQHRALLLLAPLIVAPLAVICSERVEQWGSGHRFHQQNISDHPNSLSAHSAYANYLFDWGEHDNAIRALETSSTVDPTDSGSYLDIIRMQCGTGVRLNFNYVDDLRQRIKNNPLSPYTLNTLNTLAKRYYDKTCKTHDLNTVISLLDIIVVKPKDEASNELRANMLVLKAKIYSSQRSIKQSMALF